jgi:hypothetical protein
MAKSPFDECFEWLEQYHRKPQPSAAKEFYRCELGNVPGDLLANATRTWAKKHPPDDKFPSSDQLQHFVDDESERREQRRHKEKTAPPDKEKDGARFRSLIAELERRDAEKVKRREVKRSTERREQAERRAARDQFLDEQLKSLQVKEQTIH